MAPSSKRMKNFYRTFTRSLATATVSFSFVLLPSGFAQSCVPPPSGLVGWWRAEGDALDQTGAHNGTLAGNATFGSGKAGQAFVLDGNVGTAVQLTNPAALQLQDLTIEAWIQRSSVSLASHNTGGGLIFGFGSGGYGLVIGDDGRAYLAKLDGSSEGSSFLITDT